MHKVEAVILKKFPSGEVDEIIVTLTKERGKMYFRARGVKKPAAKHAGSLRELTYLNLFFVEGNSLPIITDTQPIGTFATLTSSIQRLRAARAIIRIIEDTSVREGQDLALWHNLMAYLQALNTKTVTTAPLLLAPVFFVYKLLMHHGMQPVLTQCTVCSKNYTAQQSSFFSAPSGGLLCEQCVYADKTALSVSSQTLETLIYWHQVGVGEFLMQERSFVADTQGSDFLGSTAQQEITKTVEHFGRWHFGMPLTLQI